MYHKLQITCFPRITMSTFSSWASFARIFEMWIGCSVSYSAAGTSTWIALSAPIARAVLNVSWKFVTNLSILMKGLGKNPRILWNSLQMYRTYLSLWGTTGNGNHLGSQLLLLHFHCLFNSDLIKWVHRMLDALSHDARLVRLDSDLQKVLIFFFKAHTTGWQY